MPLTKPAFVACDETSLKVKWESFPEFSNDKVVIQYKEAFEPWELAKIFGISEQQHSDTEITLTEADLIDLKPGTAYSIRFAVIKADNACNIYGPETVFDTKPIDCTPKKKNCIIS